MSDLQSTAAAIKTTTNTAVTTKTAPNSLTPADHGQRIEDIAQLLVDSGLNSNLLNLLYTIFDLEIGATLGTGNRIRTNNTNPNIDVIGGTYHIVHGDSLISLIKNAGAVVQALFGISGGNAILQINNAAGAQRIKMDNAGNATFGDVSSGKYCTINISSGLLSYKVFSFVGVNNYETDVSGQGIIVNDTTNSKQAFLRIDDSTHAAYLSLQDSASAFFATLVSGALTANRQQLQIDAAGKIPVVVRDVTILAQTVSVASVTTFTAPANNTSIEVGGYINVTAIAGGTVAMGIAFTDINGAFKTFPLQNAVSGAFYANNVISITIKASTTATISTVVAGTITYDAQVIIKQTS